MHNPRVPCSIQYDVIIKSDFLSEPLTLTDFLHPIAARCFPRGEPLLKWTLASLCPPVTPFFASSWAYAPSGPARVPRRVFFWDGVSPSVNCVWPCVSGGLSPRKLHAHTDTHKNASLVGYTLLAAWCDDLPLSERPLWLGGAEGWASHRLMQRSQKEMACEKRRAYNSNSHRLSFWFTARLTMNLPQHIQQSRWALLWISKKYIFFSCFQTRKRCN